MTDILQNRTQAGQLLAVELNDHKNRSDVLVLALPRGGVPVGFEIAKKLNLPLDVCLVRKLGVPGRKELAMGAIGTGGVRIINQEIVTWLNITPESIERVAAEEQKELERRDRLYRENRPFPNLETQTIILVDDGIATGSTLRAAIATLKQHHPKEIIVAVPVASREICQGLKSEVDEVVCLLQPDPLHSISLWYEDFSQTEDQEVRHLLAIANDKFEQLFNGVV
ncbi:phosphoribosyltransferase [Gloeothece citriformis PCC 7424]|uniref:Phosphoribosyltransferase n=1 Tax=Gloeothece citriformis (strain PCC 7424) TaxID=65393 RepID=B7KD33_GLOC7|nr:phosphoribosyltransferase [Gloeothece citriformis]ACK73154.1 phosphoribosyltransferase [Gloeothece citriformis PCC 7424]